MQKEDWTKEEDEICCEIFVHDYVLGKDIVNVADCVASIMSNPKMKKRGVKTIKMRLRNIKALLNEWGVSNTFPLSPLIDAAMQTRIALKERLDIEHIEIPFA